MSAINMERLRVIQTFFVPVEREKLTVSILNELEKYLGKVSVDVEAWWVEERQNTIIFTVNYENMYLLLNLPRARKREVAKKLVDEYKGNLELLKRSISGRKECEPDEIFVNVIRSGEGGCEIEVECLPNLDRRISQLHQAEVHEHQMQDAYMTCERFLRTIFIGGLSGTSITKKKMMPPRFKVQFLINDISTRQITEKLNEMLNDATGEVLIFGWIGTILLDRLQELKQKGIEIKVITGSTKGIRQDVMKKEKDRGMKKLTSIVGKDHISIKPEFHGRAVVVDNKVIVGSMDLDSYSLTGTRIEFATYIEDPQIVRGLRNYFNQIFTPWKEEKQKS